MNLDLGHALRAPLLLGRSLWQYDLGVAVAIAALACFLAEGASAQPTVGSPATVSDLRKYRGFSILMEQDLLYANRNEDRNYTMGFGFGFMGELGYSDGPNTWAAHKIPWSVLKVFPWALESLDGLVRLDRLRDKIGDSQFKPVYHPSWMVGCTAFTPDALNTSDPVLDDRPYANLLFVSVRRMSVQFADYDGGQEAHSSLSSELTLGIVGTDIARSVQTRLHQWSRRRTGSDKPYDPLGWHNQISDGGELTGMYRVRYEHRPSFGNRWSRLRGGWPWVEYTWLADASVGYLTSAAVGLSARTGIIRSKFWEWDTTPFGGQNEAEGGRDGWELFAFGGYRGRAIGYNGLLQGLFRQGNPVEQDPKRGILEWEFGAHLTMPLPQASEIGVTYVVQAGRSPEFESTRFERTHTWGGLFIWFRAQ